VPGYEERRQIDILASPEACFAALLDVPALPTWQRAVESAVVLERDADGTPAVVEYVINARVRRVRYRIRQRAEPPHRIASEYVCGDFRDFGGEWRFAPVGAGRTRVSLDLHIDPGRFVPRPLRALISEAVMRSALEDLKAHLERRGSDAHLERPARLAR
jgi:ribosome-associated toxin RatA of RatAB toxin-antitoxin module